MVEKAKNGDNADKCENCNAFNWLTSVMRSRLSLHIIYKREYYTIIAMIDGSTHNFQSQVHRFKND